MVIINEFNEPQSELTEAAKKYMNSMEELDFSSVATNDKIHFYNYLQTIANNALKHDVIEDSWDAADYAVRQLYRDSVINSKDESAEEPRDPYMELYVPWFYGQHKSWTAIMKDSAMPPEGDWISIKRKCSKFFQELGIQEFLPEVDEAWVSILKTENERFEIREKIGPAIAQFCLYGGTPGLASFDGIDNFIDFRTISIRDFGIYPVTDKWKESNQVLRYNINYADLLKRKDFNQKFLKAIKPSTTHLYNDSEYFGTNSDKRNGDTLPTPFGKVQLMDIYLPSIFLEGMEKGEDITATGVYLTVAINPSFLQGY